MTDDLLRELIAEVRGLRADLQFSRRREKSDDLALALADYFGGGTFTAGGIMDVIDDDYGRLAEAVANLVDMNAPRQSRVTKLGQVLASLDGLELVGERRGAGLYRVRA